jgi:hypothetical protein
VSEQRHIVRPVTINNSLIERQSQYNAGDLQLLQSCLVSCVITSLPSTNSMLLGNRRLATHTRAILNVLSRYLSFPLRLVHRLLHSILELYTRVASRRLQRIHTGGHSDKVIGSCESTLPQYHNQLQIPVPSISGPPSNISLPSTILPHATAPPSSTHALQPTPSAPANGPTFQPFMPSEVTRYNKPLTMSRWAPRVPNGF